MTGALKQKIENYTRQMPDSDLLFPSRKGNRKGKRGGSLTGLHGRVGSKAQSARIRCGKRLVITFISRQRTSPCCSRSSDIQRHLLPFGILALMMTWWTRY